MWLALGVLCVVSFKPVVQKNIYRLMLFIAVIYNPSTYAEHNLRVYRDSIFPILCTMFFVALAGWALRLKKDLKYSTPFLVIASFALGFAWICREDGFWLLPFGVVAIAICITPLLLPVILSSSLSKGAVKMSKKKTIVKKLDSIQSFGAMNILCTDKTGTLTEDKIVLEKYLDVK